MKVSSILFILALMLTIKAHSQLTQSVKTLSGERTTLEELLGARLTILDFWATWCQPCVKAIPGLIEIGDDYREKGVQLIGINTDGPRNLAKVKPFVNTMGINYPVILDTDHDLMRDFGVIAMPSLLILNHEGTVVFAHEGYHPGDEEIIRDEIDKLLQHGQ